MNPTFTQSPTVPGYYLRWCPYSGKPQQVEQFVISHKGVELARTPGIVFDKKVWLGSMWYGPLPEPDSYQFEEQQP